jgi:hypothetical protein
MLFFLNKKNVSTQSKKVENLSFPSVYKDKIELMGRNWVQKHVVLSLWIFFLRQTTVRYYFTTSDTTMGMAELKCWLGLTLSIVYHNDLRTILLH